MERCEKRRNPGRKEAPRRRTTADALRSAALPLFFILLLLAFPLPGAASAPPEHAEKMLESVLRSAPTGIGLVIDRVIVQVNEYIVNLTGYSREELVGRSSRMLYPSQEEFDFVGREKYRQIAEHGTGSVETRWLRKDGAVRRVLLSSTPLDLDDLSAGVTFTVLDITERTRAEEALALRTRLFLAALAACVVLLLLLVARLHASLLGRKRTENELYRARMLAEAHSKAKSDFLANMSHEIRTPMNGVLGMTDLLLDSALDDEQRRWTEGARSSAESLLGIIDDVLDFSRIEAGRLELKPTDFDIGALLDDFASMMAASAQGKGLMFRCALEPDVPAFLRGDPVRLRQILTNLAGNAVKFTAEGEVTVLGSLLQESENYVMLRFSVHDTGIGVPEEKLPILFEKFVQVDSSSTRRHGGAGLGLAISKELAELMGGSVGVVSTEGKGSEFWFTVCLEKQPEGARNDEIHPAVTTMNPARFSERAVRILLAEDNAVNRSVVLGMLQKLGLTADEAVDGEEALAALRTHRYDLALMDCRMPKMDGYEVTRRLRSTEGENRHIPVVAVTAYAMKDDREKCLRAGMSDYLGKPICRNALIGILEKWLPGGGEHEVAEKREAPVALNVPRKDAAAPSSAWNRAFLLRLLDGDEELTDRIAGEFLEDARTEMEGLFEALAAGDADLVERRAHTLKGSAGSVGAESLRDAAFAIESAARADDPSGTADLAKTLEREFERIRREMAYSVRAEG